MTVLKILIKRRKLIEKRIELDKRVYYLLFLLEKELESTRARLRFMKDSGLIKSISRSTNPQAQDLITSRKSILKAINYIRTKHLKYNKHSIINEQSAP